MNILFGIITIIILLIWEFFHTSAQSAGAVEYTDCFSAEG